MDRKGYWIIRQSPATGANYTWSFISDNNYYVCLGGWTMVSKGCLNNMHREIVSKLNLEILKS